MPNASASEIAAIQARKHRPYSIVTIDGQRVYGVRARIRHGFGLPTEGGGQNVATCELTFSHRPTWIQFRQRVEVSLGWTDGSNTILRRRFTGYIEDDGASAWPQRQVVGAVGYLKLADRKTATEVTYATAPGGAGAKSIISAILTDAGITDQSIDGDDTTLGTVEDIVLGARETYSSLIQRINRPWLCVVFDWMPTGTVRRMTITGLPAGSPAWTYTYPGNVAAIENPTTIRDVRNRVEVVGLDECSAYRRADSPYVESGHDEIQEVYEDIVESDGVAADVALIWMPSVNRITRRVRIRVPGNPLLLAGDTISLTAAGLAVPINGENLWLGEIDEDFGDQGYWMWLTLYGGIGESGYPIYYPIADFNYKIVVEKFDAGSGPTVYYIVHCDGTASSSPDGSALTYAWSNDQTADVSSTSSYDFILTQAQIDGPCTVTLVVTNSSGESDTMVKPLPTSTDPTIEVRKLYLALETDAAATPDGGVTWNTATDNATCTPEVAGEDHSYFGVGAVLALTEDYLATALSTIHTFTGTTITSVWTNEVNIDKVVVGCANGSVWTTSNASAKASSTWLQIASYASAINAVIWGWDGTIWVLVGNQVIAGGAVQWNLDAGYTVKRLALSFNAHYAAGDNGAGAVQVKRNDGYPLTFEAGHAVARLGGLTHHIGKDILFAGDDQGRMWRKAEGSTEFSHVADIGGGEVFHMIRDGTNPQILWAACNSGLYKCFNSEAATPVWYQERTGKTLMVGYASAPWEMTQPVTVVSDETSKSLDLWNGSGNDAPPADWKQSSYDDSAWPAALVVATSKITTASEIWLPTPPVAGGELLFRKTFDAGAGRITTANLQYTASPEIIGLWLNSVYLGNKVGDPETITSLAVNPGIIKPTNNVLATHAKGPTALTYQSDCSSLPGEAWRSGAYTSIVGGEMIHDGPEVSWNPAQPCVSRGSEYGYGRRIAIPACRAAYIGFDFFTPSTFDWQYGMVWGTRTNANEFSGQTVQWRVQQRHDSSLALCAGRYTEDVEYGSALGSGIILSVNAWHHIEIYIRVGKTDGGGAIWVDDDLMVAGVGDFQADESWTSACGSEGGADAYMDGVCFGGMYGWEFNPPAVKFDNIVVRPAVFVAYKLEIA